MKKRKKLFRGKEKLKNESKTKNRSGTDGKNNRRAIEKEKIGLAGCLTIKY